MQYSALHPSLVSYVEKEIIPRYTAFDKAHNLNHVQTVIQESVTLASHYEVDMNMVYVIAAYHDTGLVEGREFHHLASGKILTDDSRLKEWFTEEQILIMKEAVEDHRASADYEPRTIYGKIVAEADRIIDPVVTLRRTVQYGREHYPLKDKEWQYARFFEHLQNKYAEGGYLKLWIPDSDNARKLTEFRSIIKDKVRLREIFDTLYEEL